MKHLFGKLWAVWSISKFIFTMPFIWLAYQIVHLFVRGEKRYAVFFNVTRFWGKWLMFFLGIKIKSHQTENNAINEQVIYISNHRSQIDIPVNFISTPQFVILSKVQAAKLPVVGTNLKFAHVTVDRKNKESRKQSLLALKEHLKAGRSLLLYPEGRRTRENIELGDFHDGAFILANEFDLPIVPVVIIGSDDINNPTDPFSDYHGTINVYFEEKMYGKQYDSIEDFKQNVKSKMFASLTQNA